MAERSASPWSTQGYRSAASVARKRLLLGAALLPFVAAATAVTVFAYGLPAVPLARTRAGVAAQPVSNVSVALAPTTAAGAGTGYTVSFTTSSTGGMTGATGGNVVAAQPVSNVSVALAPTAAAGAGDTGYTVIFTTSST